MDTILRGLNAAQLAAVTSEANVLQILAPPGSGKTKTLTARVAYLLEHHQWDPANIVVATFTVKAAREMSERIERMIGGRLETRLVLGTFHSIARRYLLRYGRLIGLQPGFGIADSSDSMAIIKRIIKRRQLTIDPSVAGNRISNSKARGVGVEGYVTSHPKKTVEVQEFTTVFEEYEAALKRSNTLDFNDLLLRCRDLLRDHPKCVSHVEAVLVDEFQDTSLTQFELMGLLAVYNKRISTVGDSDQSIYSFRCAEIRNLQRMLEHYPDGLTIHLEQNYRSSGAILLSAQTLIEQDQSRKSKALLPTHCVGSTPVLRKLPSSTVEATWIVQEITRIMARLGGLVSLKDVAILIRSASLSRPIETALTKSALPYRLCGGRRFYDRVEVKIILDYLRVISLPENTEALTRILNVPSRKLGEVTVQVLLEEAEYRKISLWDLIQGIVQGNLSFGKKLSKAAEQGLASFFNFISKAREKLRGSDSSEDPILDLMTYLMTKLAFRSHLQKTYPDDYESRQANVEELIAQASQISSSASDVEIHEQEITPINDAESDDLCRGEELLSHFLGSAALSPGANLDSEGNESDDQITISTIHAAKGLEWPVVFVPSVYDGSIPHSRSEDTDEERRLLYVAMTRAQALLYLSFPVRNSLRGEQLFPSVRKRELILA
ncbi:MAG: hypothetical protein M1837_003273 [Sclerophora amabilis]|nr:MAG: hypothetical protein M1837_003273 [Sclerophora amabilis]